MLTSLCKEINNWFSRTYLFGEFTIIGGEIYGPGAEDMQIDQYYRIVGSVFNDGVHKHPADDLKDEKFDGALWLMSVPQEVIDLSEEIDEWISKYGGADSPAMSPFQSESFGGYSYSKGSTANGGSSGGAAWASVFSSRLNRWRKIRP